MDNGFWQDADSRVQRAKDLLRRRKWPAALEELRAAAEIEPANPTHHFALGRCLELLGRDDEATDAFGRAADLDPHNPVYLSAYGQGLLAQRLWREAADTFDAVQKLDPQSEQAFVNRILAYTELGDHDRAEQMFYLAQQIREDGPEAFYHVGRSLAQRDLHERAIWCWRRVLELSGTRGNQPAVGLAAWEAGDLPAGASGPTLLNGDHPVDASGDPLHESLLVPLASLGGLPRAHGLLVTQSYLRIAESYVEIGDFEAARRHYLHALARDGRNVEALLGLGGLLLQMRRFDAAGQRITQAVRLDPEEPRGHFLAGRRLMLLGRLDEAGVALRRVVELDATLPRAHLLLAQIAMRQGKLDEVIRRCRAEMLLLPDMPRTLRELSHLLSDVGQHDDAAACLKRLVALCPTDSEVWQNLGVVECWRGQHLAGVVASRRALKLNPANLAAANNLVLAYLELREFDKAADIVRDGLAVDPQSRLMRRLRLRLRVMQVWQGLRRGFRRFRKRSFRLN